MVVKIIVIGDTELFDSILLDKLKENLGVAWNNPEYYMQALTHSSYAHENRHLSLEHNQRLEFLGDAVLELAVSDYLYRNHPDYPEGTLTKVRAGIVCEPSLAYVARDLRLGDFLLMGKGEERSGGRNRSSILADALESLIGAVYLDQGMERTFTFVIEKLNPVIQKVTQNGGLITDFKTRLQELVQKKSESTLDYKIVEEYGPDHSKTFVTEVNYQGKSWGFGTGRTKKEAEQAAARDALEKISSHQISFLTGEDNE